MGRRVSSDERVRSSAAVRVERSAVGSVVHIDFEGEADREAGVFAAQEIIDGGPAHQGVVCLAQARRVAEGQALDGVFGGEAISLQKGLKSGARIVVPRARILQIVGDDRNTCDLGGVVEIPRRRSKVPLGRIFQGAEPIISKANGDVVKSEIAFQSTIRAGGGEFSP